MLDILGKGGCSIGQDNPSHRPSTPPGKTVHQVACRKQPVLAVKLLNMADVTAEELATLQREFDWLLSQEVPAVLSQLREAVTECASKFPVPVGSHNADCPNSSDKFVLTTTDQLKVVVTLSGDSISAAEINLKLPRPHAKDAYHNTGVREDVPWKLQQVQDAANHLHMAAESLHPQKEGEERTFSSAVEVTAFLGTVMGSLLRARQALVVPKKRTLEDLVNSKNVKSLVPPLPREVAVSFYLQSWKLIFAVYHMVTDKGVSRFDRYQAECVVPWVNDVLLLLTVALQVELSDYYHEQLTFVHISRLGSS